MEFERLCRWRPNQEQFAYRPGGVWLVNNKIGAKVK